MLIFYRRPALLLLLSAALLLPLSACGGAADAPEASPSGSPAAAASSAASPSATAASDATALLAAASQAASAVSRYAFTLRLEQRLGEDGGAESAFEVTNAGTVERSPLKLDQTIDSVQDGESSSLRAILVPDAYYVYDAALEEWGKLSQEQAADIADTLSDYQVDPSAALAAAAVLAPGLTASAEGGRDIVRYEGSGPEALTFLKPILRSTLDLDSLDAAVRDSIALRSLSASFTLDGATRLPLAYRIVSEMTIAYEPGSPSVLKQTFEGTYSKHDTAAHIVVPKAALAAPELDPPIDDPAANEGDIESLDELDDLFGSDDAG